MSTDKKFVKVLDRWHCTSDLADVLEQLQKFKDTRPERLVADVVATVGYWREKTPAEKAVDEYHADTEKHARYQAYLLEFKDFVPPPHWEK